MESLETMVDSSEWEELRRDFVASRFDSGRATTVDLAMACRLMLGRWPSFEECARFRESPPAGGLEGLLKQVAAMPEYRSRRLALEFERPGHDCLVMTETPEGFRYFFSLRDTYVGLPVAVGVFEREVRDCLKLLLRPDMNCIDVGANFGYYSIQMGSVVRQGGGRVFSFEPEPLSFHLLELNSRENRLSNVIAAYPIACGDANGEMLLFKDPNPANYGGGHLRRPSREPQEGGRRVDVRRLDEVIPAGLRIDLVKIDVEGYEPFALRGMREIVSRSRPAIVSEFNASALRFDGADAPERFLRHLGQLGYTVYEAAPFAEGRREPFIYSGAPDAFTNLVAVPY